MFDGHAKNEINSTVDALLKLFKGGKFGEASELGFKTEEELTASVGNVYRYDFRFLNGYVLKLFTQEKGTEIAVEKCTEFC